LAKYLPEPTIDDTRAPKTAVLLVNLGTPDAATPSALRRYLGEFLSDPRVVEIPKLLWWPILNGIILRVRPAKSAAKYASVWQPGGSPLRVFTEAQTQLLQTAMQNRNSDVVVRFAMRYGNPAMAQVLSQLKQENVERILVLPMYPQYAASTTATVIDELSKWLMRIRNQPEIRTVKHYYDHPGYIAALSKTVQQHWQNNGPLGLNDKLLMSFHGLPKRSIELGDPYFDECQATAKALTKHLGLAPEQVVVTFQSRFGPAQWLQPYTAQTVQTLGQQGTKRLDVICPGFVADCLETLEEIAQEVREDFLKAGGNEFNYIPCLNNEPTWIESLADICEQHLQGWQK
jgi:protoporphyrin/coproporphyrin ferrochelatase